jgi:hypothetical protein
MSIGRVSLKTRTSSRSGISVPRYLNPVPQVDHGHDGGQAADFLVGEVRPQAAPDPREVGFPVENGQRFGPGQSRLLAFAEVVDMLPDDHPVQPFAGFAVLPDLLCVHLDAKGALVDLRRAQLNEMMHGAIEAVRRHRFMDACPGLEDAGIFCSYLTALVSLTVFSSVTGKSDLRLMTIEHVSL